MALHHEEGAEVSLEPISGLLDDRYDVVKRLASGGVGDVYLVRHRHLHEFRVVKVLRGNLASDASMMRRFQQEARIATQIKHPNVAILYDYSQLPDGRFYMVWEHIDGQDLGHVLRERGPLPPELAIQLAIQALRGLDAIHSAGVIHRDVSPDNLMLTRDLRGRHLVKIIDLGLVKDLSADGEMNLTQAGTFLGKFQYCSPEQASPEEVALDARSDLYSLTQVLYEMLTGQPPFESESQHGFVIKRLTEPPIPLRDRAPQIPLPPALEPVVMKGLERDREKRFPDATAFIHALSRVVDEIREVATVDLASEGSEPSTAVEAAASSAPLPPRRDPAATSSPRRRSTELTKEEKLELLAQIDRAASKSETSRRLHADADRALKEGRFEEAAALIERLRQADVRFHGLSELERRLAENESIARRRQQVLQGEQMLEKYLLERQQTLARLALETLLDLYPNHPKRSDYEAWVELLADEAAQQKKAEQAFRAGREAVTRGDLEGARKALDTVETLDLSGKLAGPLLREIREAERGRQVGARVGEIKDRFESLMESGDLDAAAQELERLGELDVSRVSLDNLSSRLISRGFETRYRDAVTRHDWAAARQVVDEMGQAFPSNPRPRQMFAEIARLQNVAGKQQSLDEGLATFERYLAAGKTEEAAMALRVLKQLAPNDPRVVEALRKL
jgi:serine/threonine protein kinase